eukprot:429267_1
MPGHNIKRKRPSSRHRKTKPHSHSHSSSKRKSKHLKHLKHDGKHIHPNVHSSNNETTRSIRNLKLDLGAASIQSLSKNTYKSQSKPSRNTIDLTQSTHRNALSSIKSRKSYSKPVSTSLYSTRFKKRISAPIIVPQSGSATATANLDGISTPYFHNIAPIEGPLPISLLEADEDADEDAHEYLDEDEINEMIRSCRRKSGLRSYSKSRRVSQKLFGLIESISTDNGYSLQPQEKKECEEDSDDYHVTLAKYGYVEVGVIAKSLQGLVIEATRSNCSSGESVIIKMTDKKLYFNKMSNKRGKSLYVEEDILKEKKLLMYLTANNPPPELVKFLGFFADKYRFYVVQENGGNDFFNWIVQCHKWIRAGKISLKQWSLYICDLMQQITRFLKWLHGKMKVCHLDISLENMLIKNNKYKSDGNGGIRLSRKMQIKICDFGLAEYFDPKYGFECRKYVGKTHYKAPKVYAKKAAFDARAADIWSCGVSLFMMIIGAPPYKLPIISDDHYAFIAQHNDVSLILARWGRDHYCNSTTKALLNHMLNKDEHKRCTIQQIENHPYFNQSRIACAWPPRRSRRNKNKKKKKKKNKATAPSNPICNKFENLVMSQDDGQLFKYRKRKLTST